MNLTFWSSYLFVFVFDLFVDSHFSIIRIYRTYRSYFSYILTWWDYCILIEPDFIKGCDLYCNGFNLLHYHFYNSFFKHINNNDQQSSTLPYYSSHLLKKAYQPLGGVSVEKWNNELEDELLLIWSGRKSGPGEMITSCPYPPWTWQNYMEEASHHSHQPSHWFNLTSPETER